MMMTLEEMMFKMKKMLAMKLTIGKLMIIEMMTRIFEM